jgi:amino acid transporter
MTNNEKLSLWSAILININVMFGTGIFINTVNLSKIAGFFGFLSYIIVAAILTPLIFSITALLKRHPEGGFYRYAAQELSPFWGFLSAWSYFIGKLASAALLIHVFVSLIQNIISPLALTSPFILDLGIIALFMWLNHYGLKTGTRINYVFLLLKVVPVLFTIFSGIYLFHHWSIPPETLLWSGIPSTIPLVLFAFVGFEAACSLSLEIKNPERNAGKAVVYSFIFSICLTILYQLIAFLSIGPELMKQFSFLDLFPTLIHQLFSHTTIFTQHLLNLLHIACASAALGGSFGIIFSNSWNLYILAENNHTVFSHILTQKNRHGIPFGCVLIAGLTCILHLILTQGHQIILQQISVFGVALAFTLSIVSLLAIVINGNQKLINPIIPWLGLGSCTILLISCMRNFVIAQEIKYLALFIVILGLGTMMYTYKKYLRANTSNKPT